MMKTEYESPRLEVIEIEAENILCASPGAVNDVFEILDFGNLSFGLM